MKTNITSFLENNNIENGKIKKFKKLIKNKNKKEQRKIEQKFLKPEKIPAYVGEVPKKNPVERRTIQIICNSDKEIEIIQKYFKVSEYNGKNIRDISLFITFLKTLERGEIKYDEEKKKLYCIKKQRRTII